MRSTLEITGVDKLLRDLSGLQGAELATASQRTISRVSARVLAPALAAEAPRNTSEQPQDRAASDGERHPRGKLHLRKTYTARKVRLRGKETAAYSTKARVWYAHLAIQGTRPHVIRPRTRGDGRRSLFLGFWAAEVHHPGSRGNDYVRRVAQGKEDVLVREMTKDLMKRFKR